MLSTLYGKLVAILVTFGALMVAMTIFVVRMSQEASTMEMNQRMNRALAEEVALDIGAARSITKRCKPRASVWTIGTPGPRSTYWTPREMWLRRRYRRKK